MFERSAQQAFCLNITPRVYLLNSNRDGKNTTPRRNIAANLLHSRKVTVAATHSPSNFKNLPSPQQSLPTATLERLNYLKPSKQHVEYRAKFLQIRSRRLMKRHRVNSSEQSITCEFKRKKSLKITSLENVSIILFLCHFKSFVRKLLILHTAMPYHSLHIHIYLLQP